MSKTKKESKATIEQETASVSTLANTAPISNYDRTEKRFSREEILNVFRDPLTDDNLFGLKDNREFVYYWPIHNNPRKPLRIEKLKAVGWEVMTQDMLPGNLGKRSQDATPIGTSVITKPAGGGMEHIALRMPRALYEERGLKKELYLQLTTDKILGKKTTQMASAHGIENKIDGGVLK